MQLVPKIPPISKFAENYQPRSTTTASPIGFIDFEDNDIVLSVADTYSYQNISWSNPVSTASMTAVVNTHVLSSFSAYAFNVASVLLARTIVNFLPLSGSQTGYLNTFRNISDYDVSADSRLMLGNTSIIAVKKSRFGEAIRPNSFTATTSAGYTFVDAISGDKTFGILNSNMTINSEALVLTGLGGYNSQGTYRVGLDIGAFALNQNPYLSDNFNSGSGNWNVYNNPSGISLTSASPSYDSSQYIAISNNGSTFAGVVATATLTSTYGTVAAICNIRNGATADVALILQTATTSITASVNALSGGNHWTEFAINFVSPSIGTVSAFLVARNGASGCWDNFNLYNANDISVVSWVSTTAAVALGTIVFYVQNGGYSLELQPSANRVVSTYGSLLNNNFTSGATITPSNILDGNYHSIIANYRKNQNIELFVDGYSLTSIPINNFGIMRQGLTPYQFSIGTEGSTPFKGAIAEVQILRGYLTYSEIANIQTKGVSSTGYSIASILADYKWQNNTNDSYNNFNLVASGGNITLTAGPSFLNTLSSASAGVIFYDLGLAFIHGPDANTRNSLTALTTVELYSTYKINSYNIFCTADSSRLNYPMNESAFYVGSVTSDPSENDSVTSYSSCAYQWGVNASVTSGRSSFYLLNMYQRDPYITTIGLYNPKNELLGVAKFSQPIKKPSSIPFTVKIVLDLQ